MNHKIQLVMASIISFAIGAFTVSYFNNNFQQQVAVKNFRTKGTLSNHEKVAAETKDILEKSNNLSSNPEESLKKTTALETVDKRIDYLALSTQVDSFQDTIHEKIRNKFKAVYSSDINKKGNADKKYVLESSLSEMFSEKKFVFKASLKKNQKNEQQVIDFSLTDCKSYEKIPTSTSLEDVCFYMNAYSFINNKWYKTSMGRSYGSTEWIGDQPYAMFFTEYTQGFMKASNILRVFVPLPARSGQVLSLKYVPGKFAWEQSGDLEWQPTTEKEIKDFAKSVENYMKKQALSEEQ